MGGAKVKEYEIYESLCVTACVKIQRIGWLRHTCRMLKYKHAKKVLAEKTSGWLNGAVADMKKAGIG